MNRRDTIIVAMLINTGLLVMLFVSALRTPSVAELAQSAPVQPPALVKKEMPQPKTELVAIPVEPIEKVLSPPEPPSLPLAPSAPPVVVVKEEKKAAPASSGMKIVVKKGDVLDKLAKTYGTSVEELMRVNGLSSPQLRIGQVLVLPAPKAAIPKPKVNLSEDRYYVVKTGDNLWKIATENHLKVEELLKLNNLDEKKAKTLRPGDKLLIK